MQSRVDEHGTYLVECPICGEVEAYATFVLYSDGERMPIWRHTAHGKDGDVVATDDNLVVPGRDDEFIKSCNSRAVSWQDSMGVKKE